MGGKGQKQEGTEKNVRNMWLRKGRQGRTRGHWTSEKVRKTQSKEEEENKGRRKGNPKEGGRGTQRKEEGGHKGRRKADTMEGVKEI